MVTGPESGERGDGGACELTMLLESYPASTLGEHIANDREWRFETTLGVARLYTLHETNHVYLVITISYRDIVISYHVVVRYYNAMSWSAHDWNTNMSWKCASPPTGLEETFPCHCKP